MTIQKKLIAIILTLLYFNGFYLPAECWSDLNENGKLVDLTTSEAFSGVLTVTIDIDSWTALNNSLEDALHTHYNNRENHLRELIPENLELSCEDLLSKIMSGDLSTFTINEKEIENELDRIALERSTQLEYLRGVRDTGLLVLREYGSVPMFILLLLINAMWKKRNDREFVDDFMKTLKDWLLDLVRLVEDISAKAWLKVVEDSKYTWKYYNENKLVAIPMILLFFLLKSIRRFIKKTVKKKAYDKKIFLKLSEELQQDFDLWVEKSKQLAEARLKFNETFKKVVAKKTIEKAQKPLNFGNIYNTNYTNNSYTPNFRSPHYSNFELNWMISRNAAMHRYLSRGGHNIFNNNSLVNIQINKKFKNIQKMKKDKREVMYLVALFTKCLNIGKK